MGRSPNPRGHRFGAGIALERLGRVERGCRRFVGEANRQFRTSPAVAPPVLDARARGSARPGGATGHGHFVLVPAEALSVSDRRRRDLGDGQLGAPTAPPRPARQVREVRAGVLHRPLGGRDQDRDHRQLGRPSTSGRRRSRSTPTPSTATESTSARARDRPARDRSRRPLPQPDPGRRRATPFTFAVFGDWGEVLNATGRTPTRRTS